jgi:hypothetical protein
MVASVIQLKLQKCARPSGYVLPLCATQIEAPGRLTFVRASF